jgi:putative tricarboxylic transport membrane protein
MDSAKKIKSRLDTLSAAFWFALAGAICYGAVLLGLGSAGEPGSGFILFWSGVILAALALVVLADSIRETGEARHELGSTSWPKVFLILAALVFYGLLLERLGFIFTSFLLLSFLLGISEEAKWPTVLSVAIAAALGSFALFDLWLQIRLPKGILGF